MGKVIQLFIDEKGIEYKNNTSHEYVLITGLTVLRPTALFFSFLKWLSGRAARGHLVPVKVIRGETVCR